MASRMGMDGLPDGVEAVSNGDSFDPQVTALATPLQRQPNTEKPYPGLSLDVFDTGAPAPLSGATFGMAVLSTPTAAVAGQSVNPLVGVGTRDLLQRDVARQMLERAGVSDASDLRWLAGPDSMTRTGVDDTEPLSGANTSSATPQGESDPTLLGTETTIESFEGIINGEVGPWGIGVHVARATPDDHVVVAGVQRRPLASPDAGTNGPLFPESHRRARSLLANCVSRLEAQ